MEGQVYIPFTIPAKVNIPPSLSSVTLFIDTAAANQLKAIKHDGTVLSAAAGAVPVLFT